MLSDHVQALGQDAGLAQFRPQYRASMHIWLALHAHRREDVRQASLITHHVEEACKTIKVFYIGLKAEPSPKFKKSPTTKKSPKQAAATKGKGKPAARATTVRRGAVSRATRNAQPVTPKPRGVHL